MSAVSVMDSRGQHHSFSLLLGNRFVVQKGQYSKSDKCPSNMRSAGKKVKAQKSIKETPICIEENESHTEQGEEECPVEAVNKDPAVFEGLCEGMLSALCLLQTSVSEVLDVKDEMILQNVPSSVQAQLSLSTSRLFRSLLDLSVPSTELVRLVRVFGPQWEQKRLILEQLQGEHERLHRLLSLALRRVQHLEAQLQRDAQSQHYRNWEKLFVRLMRIRPYEPSDKVQEDLDRKRSILETEQNIKWIQPDEPV